jgi:diketogulonate reductase-like aldo/keto reductase
MEYRTFGKTGVKVSAVGMGTYYGVLNRVLSKAAAGRRVDGDKVMALRKGIELGINLIDTAEAYGTEEIVAEAVGDLRRDEVFIATKVWPSHLHYDDVIKSADVSISKLGSRYIDLYQIHWPNSSIPIRETMRAMEKLVEDGKVKQIGVSNFSVSQMKEAQEALSKHELASNQVEYSLLARDAEAELLPFCKSNGMAVLAYRPMAHGALAAPSGSLEPVIKEISRRHDGRTSAQIALNWILCRSDDIFPIPRASSVGHVIENAGAVGWKLDQHEVFSLCAAAGT